MAFKARYIKKVVLIIKVKVLSYTILYELKTIIPSTYLAVPSKYLVNYFWFILFLSLKVLARKIRTGDTVVK